MLIFTKIGIFGGKITKINDIFTCTIQMKSEKLNYTACGKCMSPEAES